MRAPLLPNRSQVALEALLSVDSPYPYPYPPSLPRLSWRRCCR